MKTSNKFERKSVSFIDSSITACFEDASIKFGNKTAILTDSCSISYKELNNSAGIISSALSKITNPTKRVYLLFEHDALMILGIIGALKSAYAYIPLDPSHPLSRLCYIISDSKGSVLITNTKNQKLALLLTKDAKYIDILNIDNLDFSKECNYIPKKIDPYEYAYILYTSGSTGKPKGVIQNHRNVLHFIRNYTNNLSITSSDRLTLFSTYGFDAAVMDIFGALLNGATLYPYDIKRTGAIDNLSKWIKEQKITIFHSVPTLFRYFISKLSEDEVIKNVRLIVMGGEPVLINDVEAYKKHFSDNSLFINGLGPTESTVTLQYHINKSTIISSATVPVGYPVENTQVYLLDKNNREVQEGEVGEIVYKSDHLAIGYLNQPDKTNAAFINDPFTHTGRLFKTGDLGRRRLNEPIEFLGRNDFQIKIRGYRIELSEIESVLDKHINIQKSVIMPITHIASSPQIIAYYSTKNNIIMDEEKIVSYIKMSLPSYMIPTYFYFIDEFPLTATGKIDRMFLIDNFIPKSKKETKKPKSDIEKKLVEIWTNVLKTSDFGIDTKFTTIGGNSLLTTTVALEIQDVFDIEVPLTDLINLATIEELAHYVEENI